MWVGRLCDVRWNFPLNVPWFPFIGSEAEEGTVVGTDKELSSYDGETVSISRNFLAPYDIPGVQGFGGDLAVSSEYAMGGRGNGGVGKLTSGGHGGVGCLSFRAALGGGELTASQIPACWNEKLVSPLSEVALGGELNGFLVEDVAVAKIEG